MDVCLHYAFDSVPSISSYIQTSVENVVQQNLSASPPDYGQMGVNVFTYLHKNNYTKHQASAMLLTATSSLDFVLSHLFNQPIHEVRGSC